MKTRNKRAIAAMGILSAVFWTGCSNAQPLVQTKEFFQSELTAIRTDYDGDSVTITQGSTEKIVVTEHIDRNKPAYSAEISLWNGVLTITEGSRPVGNNVHAYLEICLPPAYQDDLSIHTTNGSIVSEYPLACKTFEANTTNGSITLSNLTAKELLLGSTGGTLSLKHLAAPICTIKTTNADTRIDGITGIITYRSTGGSLDLQRACGSGVFNVEGDGNLSLSFSQLAGEISACTKNGRIKAVFPDDSLFDLTAATKNGQIQAPVPGASDGKTAHVEHGGGSSIDLETKNGDISISFAENVG